LKVVDKSLNINGKMYAASDEASTLRTADSALISLPHQKIKCVSARIVATLS